MRISILFTCFLLVYHCHANHYELYVYTTTDPHNRVHHIQAKNLQDARQQLPTNYIASAYFTNAINSTGWGILDLSTNENYTDILQAEHAGYLEGLITAELIYQHWYNTIRDYCSGRRHMCRRVTNYLEQNRQWVDKTSLHYRTDPYWHQVRLFYRQLDSIVTGYNAAMKSLPPLKAADILWMNIQGDLEDLSAAFNYSCKLSHCRRTLTATRILGSGSCSALVKVLPYNKDLYVGHDTWSSYQSMLRLQKKYKFGFHLKPESRQLVPGFTSTFTSYPGIIHSGDDYYLLSSGLLTLETTIGNGNDSLWKNVRPTGQVLETVRAVVANRLADSGWAWCKYFRKYNSGTYNNQWMVVDYKLFKPGASELPDGVLWVLEQIPGLIVMADRTDILRNVSYWASYNVASFKEVFTMSGQNEMVKKYGDWFTYDKTPRALIFKRDHNKVNDLKSMLALMEYNDFRRDPLSRCSCTPPYSAENAVAARNDLNPANGTYPFGALGHRSHGSIDSKVTSSLLFRNLQFVARSGPVFNAQLRPFKWSDADFGGTTPHLGHPDLWEFQPIRHLWSK